MRLPDFELERFFARWEFRVKHLLCASDVEGLPMGELIGMMDSGTREMWDNLGLGYTEAAGHPALRAEIAGLYRTIAPDDVLVFSGAEEAIFAFAHVALEPGDHAVVTWPAYQSLHELPKAAGADVSLLELRHEDGWTLDPDALRAAVRPSTSCLLLNFPHNPTGALPDPATWAAIVELARDRGIRLFSDEVYRGLEHQGAPPLEPAADACETGVSLGVMSKSFALAGLRIGWVATRDRPLLTRLAAFKDYLTICASAPAEILAIAALRARDRVLQRNRTLLSNNLRLLDDFFARQAERVEWVRPRAGSTGFPRLRGAMPVARYAERLLADTGVLILPGDLFGHRHDHFRLGFGRADLPDALPLLEEHLETTPRV